MTTFEQRAYDITQEIYVCPGTWHWHQITIDLIQEEIEGLFDPVTISSEDPAACAYMIEILRDIFNPAFPEEIDFLIRLENALDEWSEDMRANNILLGLAPQK